jgi:PilZ domain
MNSLVNTAADLAEWTCKAHSRELREGVAVHTTVDIPGHARLSGQPVDMSRRGASISLPFSIAPGQQCAIHLHLEACGITGWFHVPAEVRYCLDLEEGRFRAGLRFNAVDARTADLLDALCTENPSLI